MRAYQIIVAAIAAATLAGCASTTRARTAGCGVERWAQKTLSDPAAGQVNLTPAPATIAGLVALTAPAAPTDRQAPVETTTYQLAGTIVFAKQEADGDVHLVLEDAAGNTMIIEAPDPACAQQSAALAQITAARQAVEQRLGTVASAPYTPGASYTVNAPAIVTGVGFFDRLHGQTGVAPNGIELHPLLSIRFTTGLSAARIPDLHLRNTGSD